MWSDLKAAAPPVAAAPPTAAGAEQQSTAACVPEHLCGLWQRVALETPDAPTDTTSRVFWLQTPTLFADLRIPATRAVTAGRSRLDEYGCDELVALAQQDGFAGRTALAGDRCSWHREIAYQPPTGLPDEGRLALHGDEIVEHGVHAEYREVWRRVADSEGRWLARRTVGRDGAGRETVRYLVAAGDWFLFARARPGPPLEEAASLLHFGAARGNCREELIALLDFEISLGRRAGAEPWRIELSTLPFREGQLLEAAERAAS